MEDTNVPDGNTLTDKVKVNLNMLGALVLNGVGGEVNCDRTTLKMRGFVSQDHIGGFSTKRECANTHK
jgi:hypothetical protein